MQALKTNKTPIAVLISDIHYGLSTLKIADQATRLAIEHANNLNVPLVANGDTHDGKAQLRGECVNAMIETFKLCSMPAYINIGNHCKINERGRAHALNFLAPYCHIIDEPQFIYKLNATIIPYYSDANELREYLKSVPKGTTILMHQGVNGSNSGDYFQDKSALNREDLSGFRVISGHYHNRQSFDLPHGKFDYIGNPFTLTFGESKDPEKGFQVLYEDGSLEFIPTNLRKHVIIEVNFEDVANRRTKGYAGPEDLVWVKVYGSKENLASLTKKSIQKSLSLSDTFRLDLISTELETTTEEVKVHSKEKALDDLIGSYNISDAQKNRLKELWKTLL